MKKHIKIINMFLIPLGLVLGFCYYEFGGIWVKGTASFGFVLLGAVNMVYALTYSAGNRKFPIIMFCGLLLSMIADIALQIDFITGALIFAMGHICYFAAYCTLNRFEFSDIAPISVLTVAAALFLTLAPCFVFDPIVMQYVCVAYAIIISCMVGKAIANFARERSSAYLILMVGSMLFFFSDLMLVLNMFGGAPHICDTLCLASYYPAQILLAHSIYKFNK